ncbi:MAG: hypothetical protein OTJ44_01945 [Planctomycetota bacterium]|nr:hypothetical protein [Planctomycetota bacterium]
MQKNGAVSQAFHVRYCPTNYLIRQDGNILYRRVGWKEEKAKDLLGETP